MTIFDEQFNYNADGELRVFLNHEDDPTVLLHLKDGGIPVKMKENIFNELVQLTFPKGTTKDAVRYCLGDYQQQPSKRI